MKTCRQTYYHLAVLAVGVLGLTMANDAVADTESPPSFRWGFEAGGSSATHHFDNPDQLPFGEDSYERVLTFRGGIRAARYLELNTYLDTGMKLETSGIRFQETSREGNRTITRKLYYLTFPFSLSWSPRPMKIRPVVRGGFDLGFLLSERESFEDGSSSSSTGTDSHPNVEWTFVIGGGLEVRDRWSFELLYRHGLSNLNDAGNREEHRYTNRAVSLGISYWM